MRAQVGMTKLDIRRFRAFIAARITNPMADDGEGGGGGGTGAASAAGVGGGSIAKKRLAAMHGRRSGFLTFADLEKVKAGSTL